MSPRGELLGSGISSEEVRGGAYIEGRETLAGDSEVVGGGGPAGVDSEGKAGDRSEGGYSGLS